LGLDDPPLELVLSIIKAIFCDLIAVVVDFFIEFVLEHHQAAVALEVLQERVGQFVVEADLVGNYRFQH
jgi:hypothetical protein